MRPQWAARNVYRRCCLGRSHRHHHLRDASLLPAVTSTASAFSTSAASSLHPAASSRTPLAPLSRCNSLQQPSRRHTPTGAANPEISLPLTQRRTFLGALRKPPPRELKEQQVEPGYDVLLQFRASVAEDTRRPPRAELVQAFRDFFAYKQQYGKRVNATQAQWFRRLYEYLQEDAGKYPAGEESLSLQDLRTARESLSKPPGSGVATHDHLALCRHVHDALTRTAGGRGATPLDFKRHIAVLCQYGATLEAIELLAGYWDPPAAQTPPAAPRPATSGGAAPFGATQPKPPTTEAAASSQRGARRSMELRVMVLRGLALEGREEELLHEAAAAEAACLEYMPLFQEIMVTFYARRDDFQQAQKWFEKPLRGRLLPTARTYAELLEFWQRRLPNQQEEAAKQKWIDTAFERLCDANPPKDGWDVIFQWAVVARGQGADEVRRMMRTMVKHNNGRANGIAPDATTVNGLVRAAAAKGDVLLAERFVQMMGAGDEDGLLADVLPNAHTFILQLSYRIDANDLSGAYAAFRHLQSLDCPDEEDAPVVNKYLRALCSHADVAGPAKGQKDPASNNASAGTVRLRDVLDAAEDRQVALEPATVVALCMVFLRRDQQFEAIDVLSVHAMQFSVEERAVVRDAFVDYITDSKVSTARAWDAYALLRQYFAETPPLARVRVMDAFFRRRRPDMACYVFGHMRSANDPALRPTADLYVRCLEGLGKYPDQRGLQMVHNMLKMDTRLGPGLSTRLCNALMLAYAAAGDRTRALEFWDDVNSSAEGPSYNSLAIVFWVCEALPFGDRTARAVWAKLQRMEIDVPAFVSDAYCGALAGQGHLEDVQKQIRGLPASVGYGPTAMTLGIACNALPGQALQADFATWAAAEYPELWSQVTKRGCTATADGLRRYKIPREMKA